MSYTPSSPEYRDPFRQNLESSSLKCRNSRRYIVGILVVEMSESLSYELYTASPISWNSRRRNLGILFTEITESSLLKCRNPRWIVRILVAEMSESTPVRCWNARRRCLGIHVVDIAMQSWKSLHYSHINQYSSSSTMENVVIEISVFSLYEIKSSRRQIPEDS